MIRARTESVSLILAVLSVSLAGCDSGPQLTEVKGSVSFRGKQLDDGMINFFPDSGRPMPASINPDGTYGVELPAGTYGVAVVAPAQLPAGYKEGDPPPPPDPNALPSKYSQKESSGLTATVEPGGDVQTVNFDLK